ncbi:MAG TPA: zinc ribbon domain-containing protein [Acidimicrobiales bacterium]|nr:zinc ribbon domain-containing protein [Acidimicrobiales bacterium]
MTGTHTCESCGMPIETGRYCAYCTDGSGALQSFDERFERMVAWQARRQPEANRDDLEAATLAYMSTMPAWRDHPRVETARRERGTTG